jgi:hypothetical protein
MANACQSAAGPARSSIISDERNIPFSAGDASNQIDQDRRGIRFQDNGGTSKPFQRLTITIRHRRREGHDQWNVCASRPLPDQATTLPIIHASNFAGDRIQLEFAAEEQCVPAVGCRHDELLLRTQYLHARSLKREVARNDENGVGGKHAESNSAPAATCAREHST